MSPRFRKVALIAASLGPLLSLFLALRPQEEETATATTVATTTAPATTAPATTAEPPPATTAPKPPPPRPPAVVRIQFTVASSNPGLIRRSTVRKGRKVAHRGALRRLRPRPPARLRPDGRRRTREPRPLPVHRRRARPLRDRARRPRACRSPISRFALDRRPRDRRRPRPAGSDVALLVGRAPSCSCSRFSSSARSGSARSSSGWPRGGRLPPWLERALRSTALHVVLGALSAGLLVLVFLAALFGEPSSATNLAPTFIYVVFWLGIVPLQVRARKRLAGAQPVARDRERGRLDLARARADVDSDRRVSRATRRLSGGRPALRVRGARALLRRSRESSGAGARDRALQLRDLVRDGRVRPAALGGAGGGIHGLLRPARAHRALRREGRAARRPDAALRARRRRPQPGMLAVVAVMLGSVGFDGLQPLVGVAGPARSGGGPVRPRLTGRRRPPRDAPRARRPRSPASRSSAARTSRRSGSRQRVTRSDRSLAADFVRSLVPIALVYAVAHYFTLLVVYSQVAVSLARIRSATAGTCFGTADFAAQSGAALAERRLVRPGRRARRGPRRRARGRPRPSDQPLPGARGTAVAVRAARADGRLHARRAVAALAGMSRRRSRRGRAARSSRCCSW